MRHGGQRAHPRTWAIWPDQYARSCHSRADFSRPSGDGMIDSSSASPLHRSNRSRDAEGQMATKMSAADGNLAFLSAIWRAQPDLGPSFSDSSHGVGAGWLGSAPRATRKFSESTLPSVVRWSSLLTKGLLCRGLPSFESLLSRQEPLLKLSARLDCRSDSSSDRSSG